MVTIKHIYTRMFRVLAIIYSRHASKLESLGAIAHLNTSCKHFLFFVWEFDLVNAAELEALGPVLQNMRDKYD